MPLYIAPFNSVGGVVPDMVSTVYQSISCVEFCTCIGIGFFRNGRLTDVRFPIP